MAEKKHHEHSAYKRKHFMGGWGLALQFLRGSSMSVMMGKMVAGWCGATAVAGNSHLIPKLQEERE